jgi:hypothetical protein
VARAIGLPGVPVAAIRLVADAARAVPVARAVLARRQSLSRPSKSD